MLWLKFFHRFRLCDLSQYRSLLVLKTLADFQQIFVEGSWECCSWSPLPASNVSGCEIFVYGQLCRGFT